MVIITKGVAKEERVFMQNPSFSAFLYSTNDDEKILTT